MEGLYTKQDLLADEGELALHLAMTADLDFAKSKFAQDYDILSVCGGMVARALSYYSDKTGWVTDIERVLKLDNGQVAINLAYTSDKTGWTTNNKAVLSLRSGLVDILLKQTAVMDKINKFREALNS